MTKKDIVYHNGRKYKVPRAIREYIDELETSIQQLNYNYNKIKFIVVSPGDVEPMYCLKGAVAKNMSETNNKRLFHERNKNY